MKFLAVVLGSWMLVACGSGGGGGSPAPASPVASILSFPLQTGYKAMVASGLSKSFTVSGTCTGTGTKVSSPAATTPASFEGVAGFSTASTLTYSLSSPCSSKTIDKSTSYFDSNYLPLGTATTVNYGVYLTPPSVPLSVTVGAAGPIGTETLYVDSTKAVTLGSIIQSYVIEADVLPINAIVNLISKITDASVPYTVTEQDRYRIDANGTLTPVSIDIQFAGGSVIHLVLTF